MADIDLFLVAGQSNAQGRGTAAQAPAVTNGSLSWHASTLVDLEDPVGGANTGSAWPAFANAYGRCAVVEAASGGSNLIGGLGGGNWTTGGTLFAESVTKAQAAVAALESAGWTVTLRGVIWHQGESEGLLYEGSAGDLATAYEAALVTLLDRYRAAFSDETFQMWVARLGVHGDGDTDLYAAVRDAQDAACAATAGMHMAYTGCIEFADLGWMKADDLHYTQPGLNAMGSSLGAHVRADIPVEGSEFDVNGDPIVQYQRVDGEAVPFTDRTRGV